MKIFNTKGIRNTRWPYKFKCKRPIFIKMLTIVRMAMALVNCPFQWFAFCSQHHSVQPKAASFDFQRNHFHRRTLNSPGPSWNHWRPLRPSNRPHNNNNYTSKYYSGPACYTGSANSCGRACKCRPSNPAGSRRVFGSSARHWTRRALARAASPASECSALWRSIWTRRAPTQRTACASALGTSPFYC